MKNKKTLVAIIALVLVAGIAGTFAYFQYTEKFDNDFHLASQEIEFKEEFDSPDDWTPCTVTPKVLEVENSSNFAIKTRVKYEERWEKLGDDGRPTGELLLNQIGNEDAAVKNINTTDWTLNRTDGWYYYNADIAAGGKSTQFIDKVTFNCNATSEYSNAEYHLVLTVQTMQADGTWQ
ncbi:BsaA family SipW-dependent biofilm matrix protein [Candidatus Saccharibacteria bacterium]|nr:BsaA family SipW-dependent biofilm matrix protein [Candidatus Saccharibacteria bacterium]